MTVGGISEVAAGIATKLLPTMWLALPARGSTGDRNLACASPLAVLSRRCVAGVGGITKVRIPPKALTVWRQGLGPGVDGKAPAPLGGTRPLCEGDLLRMVYFGVN